MAKSDPDLGTARPQLWLGMGRFFAFSAALICLTAFAAANQHGVAQTRDGGLSDIDRTEIKDVIEAQLAAFQADEAELAFSFASPAIQDMFGTPIYFMSMVRTTYSAVYRPRSYAFGALAIDNDGVPSQILQVTGPNGFDFVALYRMQYVDAAGWRIGGVVLERFSGEKT